MRISFSPLPIKLLFSLIVLISMLAMGLIYTTRLAFPIVRSDGIGYYSYLPAVFVHQSLDFEAVVAERFEETEPKELPQFGDSRTLTDGTQAPEFWTGLRYYEETDKYVNQYPPGVAIMTLPFFLVAHILTLLTGLDQDGGYGVLYQLAVGSAGLFYFWAGIFLLYKILAKHFSVNAMLLTLLAIVFGTNLFHHGTYEASFSHIFSFFLITLVVWIIPQWYERPNIRTSILLATVYGLIFLVRPNNAIAIILFALYGISSFESIKARVYLWLKHWKLMCLMILIGIICTLPLLLYYQYAFGEWITVPYRDNEGFDFTSPQIGNVLLSVRKGLFFWSPALLFAIPGWFVLKKYQEWRVAILITFVVALWVISSWWHWPYGGSFGQRAFVDWFVLFAIPMAGLFSFTSKQETPLMSNNMIVKYLTVKNLTVIVLCTMIILTIKVMMQYWLGVIEIDGTTFEYYLDNFFVFENRT